MEPGDRLSREEFEAHLASETSSEELQEKRSLIAWFTRRYPTPEARLAYNLRYVKSVARVRGRR